MLALFGAAAWSSPAHAAVPDYQAVELPSPGVQAASNFGERLRALGDVDGDGVRDLLVSSSNYDGPNPAGGLLANSGRVYIFSGRTRQLLRVIEPPTPQSGGKLGFWDANVGDVNGDGRADFASSAPGYLPDLATITIGRVYIFSGATGAVLRTLDPPEALNPAPGGFGGDFGGNLIGPGDLDGDGIGDVVATASGAAGGIGAAYAFSGATGAFL
ncbi:MAG: integrin alpha, partial [Solirubrobacteraceae bacterium]